MLIRGLGWPAAEVQRPGPQGQTDPPAAGGVLAGPGLRSAEDELSAQLLTLQVVSSVTSLFTASVVKSASHQRMLILTMLRQALSCGLLHAFPDLCMSFGFVGCNSQSRCLALLDVLQSLCFHHLICSCQS